MHGPITDFAGLSFGNGAFFHPVCGIPSINHMISIHVINLIVGPVWIESEVKFEDI